MKQVYLVTEKNVNGMSSPVIAFANRSDALFFANYCLNNGEVRAFPIAVNDWSTFDELDTTEDDK